MEGHHTGGLMTKEASMFSRPPKHQIPWPLKGVRVRFGAGFTQQYQDLKHENPTALNNQTTNRLYPLQSGFMTAQANLFMDVQLADGIRLNVTSYMSSRHHNETWVKGGYIQFDKLPFKGEFWTNPDENHYHQSWSLWKSIMVMLTSVAPDGGQTIYNPFMDNYIVDEFATEIGGEVYLHKKWLVWNGRHNQWYDQRACGFNLQN
jgi:hypothetical protein